MACKSGSDLDANNLVATPHTTLASPGRSSESVREQAADPPFYIEGQALTIPLAALAYLADISDMTSAQNFLHCQAVQFCGDKR